MQVLLLDGASPEQARPSPTRLHHPASPSALYHSCLESSSSPAILLPEQPFELRYAPLDLLGPVFLAILFLYP